MSSIPARTVSSKNLKAAALVLNKTDATIAGTEVGGFDTHQQQGTLTGSHPNLQRRIGWALYGLWKYFTKYPRARRLEQSRRGNAL
jgi:hypothetical protein